MTEQIDHLNQYLIRLLYFHCTNNLAITAHTTELQGYQEKSKCLHLVKAANQSIQGFFMLPAALSWIIAPYAKQLYIKDQPSPPRVPGDPKNPHCNTYIFQMVYAVCKGNRIVDRYVWSNMFYLEKMICEMHVDNSRKIPYYWEEKEGVPIQKVQSFYMVPERFYWMLAPFVKHFYIADRLPMIAK